MDSASFPGPWETRRPNFVRRTEEATHRDRLGDRENFLSYPLVVQMKDRLRKRHEGPNVDSPRKLTTK